MALVELAETWDGRSTNYKPEFRRGSWIQERTHVRVYHVEVSTRLHTSQEVLTLALAAGLPATWTVHPSDPLAQVWSYDVANNTDAPEFWTIRVNYQTAPHPVDEPADIEWGDGSFEFVLEGAQAWIDSSGTEHTADASPYPGLTADDFYPITNSALDPFDPPPTDPEHYRILTVKKNFDLITGYTGTGTGVTPTSGFDPRIMDRDFSRYVNNVPFVVPGVGEPFENGTVFLAEHPRAVRQFRNAVEFWQVTFTFWIRARGWELRILDMGYRRFAVADTPGYFSGEENTVIYRGTQPAQNPVKLDGAGNEAAIGNPPVILRYRLRGLCDFNELNLFEGL